MVLAMTWNSDERRLGIVGGVSPESTTDYYGRLIVRWRDRGPAGTYPPIVVDSLNSRQALDALLAGDVEPLVQLFNESTERLARAGARLAIVASVMTHMVFPQVSAASPIPMLSIIDTLVAEAQRRGVRRPLIIGTRPTTEGSFFARPFAEVGIELVRPDEADRAYIHEIYFSELVRGIVRDETRDRLKSIIESMAASSGIDAVILAGTEIPLILREPSYSGLPVLDSSGIHVEAALDWMLDATAR